MLMRHVILKKNAKPIESYVTHQHFIKTNSLSLPALLNNSYPIRKLTNRKKTTETNPQNLVSEIFLEQVHFRTGYEWSEMKWNETLTKNSYSLHFFLHHLFVDYKRDLVVAFGHNLHVEVRPFVRVAAGWRVGRRLGRSGGLVF